MLDKLLIKQIKKLYPSFEVNDQSVKKIGGLTSENFCINLKTGESLMLKVYTSISPVDIEKLGHICQNNFGAKIISSFPQGRIEKWLGGNPMKQKDIKGNLLKKIAKKICKFHNTLGLIHGDLNLNNIIMVQKKNVRLIDFEYSRCINRFSDRADDISDFFTSCMYDYMSDEWYKPNTNHFPSRCHIRIFLEAYIDEYKNFSQQKITVTELQQLVLDSIPKIHTFWASWASKKADSINHQLFKVYRLKLAKTNPNVFLKKNVIYSDGVFDLLHTGHLCFFEKIRKVNNCKKLIIGVISDANAESYKRLPIINCNNRAKLLNRVDIIDETIKNCPLNNITKEFLDEHGIDLVVYGGDPNNSDPLGTWKAHYQVAIDRNALKIIPYSIGMSTSEIIKKIKTHM